MPGAAQASASEPTQREHLPGFDFAPSSRTAPAPEPEMQTAPAAGRRQERASVDVAEFCQRSSGRAVDHTDRVFSVLSDNVDVSLGGSAPTQAAERAAAKDEPVMPLIWQNRQAETAAAEAECMEQNMRASRAFREDADATTS